MDEAGRTSAEEYDAREQLTLVQSILERAGRTQRPLPVTYMAWGCTSALFNLAYVPSLSAMQDRLLLVAQVMLIAAYALTLWEFVKWRRLRATMLDRQAIVVFAVVTTVLWTLKYIWFSNGLVGGVAFAFMWSLGFAISLIVHGAGPMRPLFVGGWLLLASVYVASFMPHEMALILAVGNLLGVAGPGLYFTVKRT